MGGEATAIPQRKGSIFLHCYGDSLSATNHIILGVICIGQQRGKGV
jgi:hypothetical protein